MIAGLVCAIQLDNGDWRRGRIIGLADESKASGEFFVKLIDVGSVVTLPADRLCKLDPRWSVSVIPAMAIRCSLWGIRPAGHMTKWPGRAAEDMKDWGAHAKALYFCVYHYESAAVDGEDEPETVRWIRLYNEYVKPGGPLDNDAIRTDCINDTLLAVGLALKMPSSQAPVSVQPAMEDSNWSWPACLTLPPDPEVKIVWVNEAGQLLVHHTCGPSHQMDAITSVLNWWYTGSKPDESELTSWRTGEPCVVRFAVDGNWCRALIVKPDDELKVASVLFIDYGNVEVNQMDCATVGRAVSKCFILFSHRGESSIAISVAGSSASTTPLRRTSSSWKSSLARRFPPLPRSWRLFTNCWSTNLSA